MQQNAMLQPPKVSVLMSCYNKGEFLQESIRSVLNQSLSDFEFVIFDNQSTDNSVALIREFDDPRIKFFQNSRNMGPAASMNNCIEAACGKYAVVFHGDDVWDDNFLQTNFDYLERHPSINVCHSLMHTIDERGAKTVCQPVRGVDSYQIQPSQETLKRLFKGSFILTPTVVYRRSAIHYFDFRYTYVGDWDAYLQYAADGSDFLFINEPLMSYRVSGGSETSIGMRGGDLIIETYLMLRNFFAGHPECRGGSRSSFKRLSAATLRRALVAESREQALFLINFAMMSYPLQVFNPVFHVYLLIGILFGPAGLRLLKRKKRSR